MDFSSLVAGGVKPLSPETLSSAAALSWRAFATTGAIAAGARVSLPLPDWMFSDFAVPVTGQTLGASLSGMLFGRESASLGAALYVLLALCDAPILAGGRQGVSKISLGYIVGFIPCAFLAETDSFRFPVVLVAAALSQSSALFTGVACFHASTNTPLAQVWRQGGLPYLPGLLVKSIIIAICASSLGRRL